MHTKWRRQKGKHIISNPSLLCCIYRHIISNLLILVRFSSACAQLIKNNLSALRCEAKRSRSVIISVNRWIHRELLIIYCVVPVQCYVAKYRRKKKHCNLLRVLCGLQICQLCHYFAFRQHTLTYVHRLGNIFFSINYWAAPHQTTRHFRTGASTVKVSSTWISFQFISFRLFSFWLLVIIKTYFLFLFTWTHNITGLTIFHPIKQHSCLLVCAQLIGFIL